MKQVKVDSFALFSIENTNFFESFDLENASQVYHRR
jgi:hypothetical protein